MIITIAGKAGSGKSTVGKRLAEMLHLKHYSTGDFMRELAKERGMSLLKLSEVAEKERWVDEALDARQIRLGKEEDGFIIDARIGWHFIPHSIKIFLDVSPEVGARRVTTDRISDRSAEPENTDIGTTMRLQERRERSERLRYERYYGIKDFQDPSHFDLIINTDDDTIEDTADRVMAYLRREGPVR
ncbi:nucleoside monophosphate kinase [Candidatus Woesearchaeota archaeon]|nr:nucleoside monophosphate kinase [Candidatus Woesearchaeota archaeon]